MAGCHGVAACIKGSLRPVMIKVSYFKIVLCSFLPISHHPSNMSVTIVVIAGLTGKLGRSIASNLLRNHPEIKIHGIVRSLDKVDQAIRQSPKVALFQAGAFDNEALRRGLKNASVCICCYLGDNDLMTDGQKSLIDACIDEKVARYIASDWSMDYRGLEFGQHPLKDPMKHIQAYLEEKEGLDQIKGVHVLNGGFMDIILAPFVGFLLPELNTFNYWGTGDEQIDLTTYDDAATFTAEVAADSSAAGFLNGRYSAHLLRVIADNPFQLLGVECLPGK